MNILEQSIAVHDLLVNPWSYVVLYVLIVIFFGKRVAAFVAKGFQECNKEDLLKGEQYYVTWYAKQLKDNYYLSYPNMFGIMLVFFLSPIPVIAITPFLIIGWLSRQFVTLFLGKALKEVK